MTVVWKIKVYNNHDKYDDYNHNYWYRANGQPEKLDANVKKNIIPKTIQNLLAFQTNCFVVL